MSIPINVAFLSIHGDAHSSSSSNCGDIEYLKVTINCEY